MAVALELSRGNVFAISERFFNEIDKKIKNLRGVFVSIRLCDASMLLAGIQSSLNTIHNLDKLKLLYECWLKTRWYDKHIHYP